MNTIEQVFGPTTNSAFEQPQNELGQEDFLKLLVAQLKNQDPNDPADNGEFLGQIAQFSMVSGIDELGVSFDGIAGSLYTNQAMQAAQLVGKDALVETNAATLNQAEPIDGFLEFSDDTQAVSLQIHDASGSLVKEMDVASVSRGMERFTWNGIDEEGNQLPPGDYIVTAEGLINGELSGIPVHIFSEVESVSVDRANTNILLHLANGQSVGFPQVREYR